MIKVVKLSRTVASRSTSINEFSEKKNENGPAARLTLTILRPNLSCLHVTFMTKVLGSVCFYSYIKKMMLHEKVRETGGRARDNN